MKPKRQKRRLSHLDARGTARMVDVSAKRITTRRAVATAEVHLSPETLRLIHDGRLPKGDVFAVARLAGIQAAKKTGELIPLCHPLPVDAVAVEITAGPPDRSKTGRERLGSIHIKATATIKARTGVDMEALTAAAVAALTIYDMCKAIDRGIVIGPIRLEEKSGGRSGTWGRK